MVDQIRFLRTVIRDYGLQWVIRRGVYEFQVRYGWHRLKFRQRAWDRDELARWLPNGESSAPKFFFKRWKDQRRRFFFNPSDRASYQARLGEILGDAGLRSLTDEAERIRSGEFTYFFKHRGKLGSPPDWHLNPFTGGKADAGEHWSRLPMYSPVYGDMKYVWEPGRFASAYTLARASWATGDDSFGEVFWGLLESWRDANPPNHGPHWKCGQEASLRLMAWYFALHAFLDSPATTPERFAMLAGMAAAQADRIERDHIYSHLQQNNHAMSEGVGLYATGLLFPQFKRAEVWRRKGLRILEEEGRSLIRDDGTFRQKSHNYHRLMLHLYLYAGRLAEMNGDSFTDGLKEKLSQATDYLYQVQDEVTGTVPNFGANDGALILPLNDCDYRDFRPICALSQYGWYHRRIYESGPWDEDLLWLYGTEALGKECEPPKRINQNRSPGGIFTIRGKQSWAFTHCESFKDRPGQADALHLDLWWKGINLTPDPGSFLYFAEGPWRNGLSRTQCHSTITVDDTGQMERGARFIQTNWHRASHDPLRVMCDGRAIVWQGEHDAYCRLSDPVTHRRAVALLANDVWVVIDDLVGRQDHSIVSHWMFPDLPASIHGKDLKLETSLGEYWVCKRFFCRSGEEESCIVERGSEETAPRGWISEYYGKKEPGISLLGVHNGALPCRYITIFSEQRPIIDYSVQDTHCLGVQLSSGEWMLDLKPIGKCPVVANVTLRSADLGSK